MHPEKLLVFAQSNLSDWMQFGETGLAGLVIGALFCCVFFLFRLHRDERADWREDIQRMADTSDRRSESVIAVVRELTDAVKDLHRATKV